MAVRTLLTWAEKFAGVLIPHELLMEIGAKPGSAMLPVLMDSLNNKV